MKLRMFRKGILREPLLCMGHNMAHCNLQTDYPSKEKNIMLLGKRIVSRVTVQVWEFEGMTAGRRAKKYDSEFFSDIRWG